MKFSKIFALSLAFVGATAFAKVEVQKPVVKISPTKDGMAAAYFTLKNTSPKEVALTSVETDAAKTAEIHNSMQAHDTMKMEPVKEIQVKAHSETILHPGGFHIMLIGLKPQIKTGQKISLTLKFSDGETQTLQAPVQAF